MNTLIDIRKSERVRLERFKVLEIDDRPDIHGVLLGDQIEYYVQKCNMVYPFEPENLKPAGYELTVGDEFYLGGEYKKLTGKKDRNEIVIPPFEVAILKTKETLNIPRFVIGRWNLRVAWVYKGLLWTGAPQVDPGYVGHLFCPIYNLSNRPVRIRRDDAIALMDFVKTTPFDCAKDSNDLKRYPKVSERNRIIIQDYGGEELDSALYDLAIQKIGSMEDQIEKLQTRFFTTVSILFAGLGILIATVATLFSSTGDHKRISFVIAATVGLSAFSAMLAIFHFMSHKALFHMQSNFRRLLPDTADYSRKRFWRWWWILTLASLAAATFIAVLGWQMVAME